eukprot:COSAG03_NODE_628_length_6625_cov_9.247165_3_plen_122_part_00
MFLVVRQFSVLIMLDMEPATRHYEHTLGSIQLGLRLMLSIYTQVSHAPVSTLIDSARGRWASVPPNQQDSTWSNPRLPTSGGPVACKAARPLTGNGDRRAVESYLLLSTRTEEDGHAVVSP